MNSASSSSPPRWIRGPHKCYPEPKVGHSLVASLGSSFPKPFPFPTAPQRNILSSNSVTIREVTNGYPVNTSELSVIFASSLDTSFALFVSP